MLNCEESSRTKFLSFSDQVKNGRLGNEVAPRVTSGPACFLSRSETLRAECFADGGIRILETQASGYPDGPSSNLTDLLLALNARPGVTRSHPKGARSASELPWPHYCEFCVQVYATVLLLNIRFPLLTTFSSLPGYPGGISKPASPNRALMPSPSLLLLHSFPP